MNLNFDADLVGKYRSRSQIARLVTESWCLANLYCPSCPEISIESTPRNTRGIDFTCRRCNEAFQLKSSLKWNQAKIVDAAYSAMIAAIQSDTAPNLVLLNYTEQWKVQNLLLVPRYFFTESTIEVRKPLSPTARRAGWVGCNILLSRIPPEGRIPIVENGSVHLPSDVRIQFGRSRAFEQLAPSLRGWTLDVLQIVRRLNRAQFSLSDVYTYDVELAARHPGNRNIRPKIRQQLQILRDLGFLHFLGKGTYGIPLTP